MAYDPDQITFFAKTDARGQNVPFGIKAKDRTRHVYVIGKTGMGKSTLLENMAVQDMQNGNGLAFIDPHGATAETLLEYVPEDRVDDVLYFAPFDTENPIAFNVMEDVGPEKRHLVAAGLMSVFKKIWVDAWSARMEYILQNTLLALLEYPDSTLLGVNRMLSEKHYRKAVIDNISDPAVKSFWVDEFLNYNERYMQEAGDAIKNKIGQFTANPLIRNIIGQPRTSFDLRKMMDGKKILIANLSKGLIGEGNANLLGSMLTTRIYLGAMSRADLSPMEMKQMPNFYFYVDEFQSFANATFADILSEARKYHLNLTIAHQYVEQMEEEVRNAVFGNVGTVISFRVGPFDAETLETIFAPQFYAVDICNLGFAQIYLTLMIDGIGSRPFSATTLPPIEAPAMSCRDMVIARSREKFGSPRAKVDADVVGWMEKSYAPERPAGKPGGGNNGKPAPGKNGGPSNNVQSKPKPPGNGKPSQGQSGRDTQSKPTNQQLDVNELRNVLASLAKDTTGDQPKANTKHKNTDTPKDTTKLTNQKSDQPSKPPQTKDTSALAAAIKQVSSTNTSPAKTQTDKSSKDTPKEQPAKTEPKDDTQQPQPSLKDALAAVLAERKTTDAPTNTTDKTAARVEQPKAAEPSEKETPKPTPAANAPTQPVATDVASTVSSNPQASYRDAKSKDSLDPKQLERMLRVTSADNSPFKKR